VRASAVFTFASKSCAVGHASVHTLAPRLLASFGFVSEVMPRNQPCCD
jgi:hypothetical protein